MADVTPPPPIVLQGPSNTPGAPPLSLAALSDAINTYESALIATVNTSLDGLQTTLTGIQGGVTTAAGQIQASLTAAQSSLASDSTALGSIQTAVTAMQTQQTAIQAALAALGASPPPPPAGSTPSPDGTTVTTAGPALIDAALNSWTLQQSAANGMQVALNGTVDQSTSNVVLIGVWGGVLYQENNWVPPGWWSNPTGVAGVWVTATDPRPAGAETITDVRLSNQSFTGGAAAGTFIGTISVIASPNAFSGTLTLGGPVASSFAVTGTGSGPFSLNTYTAGLAVGTYAGLTITPTMAGAAGSGQPFGPFTITGAAAGGGIGPSATGTLVAEFNTATGNTVYPQLFGGATCTQQDYNWTLVGNAAFRAACRSYPWSLCRYNCNSGASTWMWASVFGSNPTTTNPNWTNFDLFLTHANEMFDLTKTWIVLGLGGVSGDGLDLMGDNISQFCGMVQLIGNRLKSFNGSDGKLVPIKAFEFLNEVSGRVDVNTYHQYFDAVADTLHTIDQSWQLWGPVSPNDGGYDSSFLGLETSAHLGAFCDHVYLKCPGDTVPSDYQVATAAPPQGTDPAGWMADRRAMIESHGFGTTFPIFCGEWDLDCAPPTDPRTFTIIGALMCNSWTRKLFQNAGSHPAYGANWELGADGNYGLFQANSGNEYNDSGYHITPKGAFLSKGGSVTAGAEVTCQSVHGMTSYATKSGAAFALVTMNPPGNGSKTETVALSHCPVNTSGSFTAHVWTQNAANPTGILSTVNFVAGTASVTFTDSSNTIIYYP
jgi:hypothetical protein